MAAASMPRYWYAATPAVAPAPTATPTQPPSTTASKGTNGVKG